MSKNAAAANPPFDGPRSWLQRPMTCAATLGLVAWLSAGNAVWAAPEETAEDATVTDDKSPGAKAAPKGAAGVEEVESVDVSSDAGSGDDWFGDAYPQMDRVLDLYTGRVARKGAIETLIGHRNWEGALREPLRDLFGFDGGALKINLGLRYGILDRLDVGILRQNRTFERYTTWEFDFRAQALTQAANHLDVAFRLGLSLFSHPDKYASGFFAQMLVSRVILNRFLLGGGILYSSSSSGQNKRDSNAASSFALMLQTDVRVLEWLSLAGEITAAVSGYQQPYPCMTFGPKIITNRHTFSIVISNTQYVTSDGIVANTYRSSYRDWVLGFLITREI